MVNISHKNANPELTYLPIFLSCKHGTTRMWVTLLESIFKYSFDNAHKEIIQQKWLISC